MALTIKHGKFYRDGMPEQLEFGNKEQINALKRINDYINEGEYPTVREVRHIEVLSKCPCGVVVEFCDLELEEDEHLDMLAGKTHSCHNCGLQYKLACDSNGDLVVKMVPAKKEGKKNG